MCALLGAGWARQILKGLLVLKRHDESESKPHVLTQPSAKPGLAPILHAVLMLTVLLGL